jgi:holo-[acyl-carrier protein] synthase
MILGLGLDVVDVEAFAAQLADPASGFVEATFRPGERRRRGAAPGPSGTAAERAAGAAGAPRWAQHLAGRFAAKEALVKAWSVARRGQPPALAQVDLRDVEVVDDGFGRPGLRLHGPVRAAVAELAPGATVTAPVSISHDGPTAAAVVILEA